MVDYMAMYLKLFNSITEAMDILSEAQLECESLYIESELGHLREEE